MEIKQELFFECPQCGKWVQCGPLPGRDGSLLEAFRDPGIKDITYLEFAHPGCEKTIKIAVASKIPEMIINTYIRGIFSKN